MADELERVPTDRLEEIAGYEPIPGTEPIRVEAIAMARELLALRECKREDGWAMSGALGWAYEPGVSDHARIREALALRDAGEPDA